MKSVPEYKLASLFLIMTLAKWYPYTLWDFSINPYTTSKIFQAYGTDVQLLSLDKYPHQGVFPQCPKPESFNIVFFPPFFVPEQLEYTKLWKD